MTAANNRKIPAHVLNAWGREMKAVCLTRQGRTEEAVQCLEALTSETPRPDLRLFLARVLAEAGKWEAAVHECVILSKISPLGKNLARQASDLMLKATVHYSESQGWDRAAECLVTAQKLAPDNPCLNLVPETLAKERAVLLFSAEDFPKATEEWKQEIRDQGYTPQRIHLLAITMMCRLDEAAREDIDVRLGLLVEANQYWTAVSKESDYWKNIWNLRKQVYSSHPTQEEFFETSVQFGLSRLDARLHQIQTELSEAQDSEGLKQLEMTRTEMDSERHSAQLIEYIRPHIQTGWPLAGLGLIESLWGSERLKSQFEAFAPPIIGTQLWLLAGLRDPECRPAFVQFLGGNFQGCLEQVKDSPKAVLKNLMGLALIRSLKAGMESGHVLGCRDAARYLPGIPDPNLRQQAISVVQEITLKRVKTFLAQNQRDEAVEFLEAVIRNAETAPHGVAVRLDDVRDSLSGTLLQRAESAYLAGDNQRFHADLERGFALAKNKIAAQSQLLKIAHHQISQKANAKDFKSSIKFLEDLEARFPNLPMLLALKHFVRGLEMLEKVPEDKTHAVGWFEKAFKANPNDEILTKTYSVILSNHAVDLLNLVINNPMRQPGALGQAIQSAKANLNQALSLDPANQHARDQLQKIEDLERQGAGFM